MGAENILDDGFAMPTPHPPTDCQGRAVGIIDSCWSVLSERTKTDETNTTPINTINVNLALIGKQWAAEASVFFLINFVSFFKLENPS